MNDVNSHYQNRILLPWMVTRCFQLALLLAFSGCDRIKTADPQQTQQVHASVVSKAEAIPQSEELSDFYRFSAMSSCSSTGCHGQELPRNTDSQVVGCSRNEAVIWHAVDPHTEALVSLESPLAKQIMSKLYDENDRQAIRETSCLSCHAPQLIPAGQTETQIELSVIPQNTECMMCHGVEGEWIQAHPTWAVSQEEKAEKRMRGAGMTPLAHPDQRVQLCVSCHIGSSGDEDLGIVSREVDHDLIGAGHPRLDFDFSAFSNAISPHWNHEPEEDHPSLSNWIIGQWYGMQASLELLEYRLQPDSAGYVQMEFSEMSCFACHRELDSRDLRSKVNQHEGSKWGNPYQDFFPAMLDSFFIVQNGNQEISGEINQLKNNLASIENGFEIHNWSHLGDKMEACKNCLNAMQLIQQSDNLTSPFGNEIEISQVKTFLDAVQITIREDLRQNRLSWRKAVSFTLLIPHLLAEVELQSALKIEIETELDELRHVLDFEALPDASGAERRYLFHSPAGYFTNEETGILMESILSKLDALFSTEAPDVTPDSKLETQPSLN
ncbi:MAG TPA: hypothetical protein DIW81_29620 [Planctomycetaceae bacterium]|nr:hypothetical protein [Planctomycetaceae bacterium]